MPNTWTHFICLLRRVSLCDHCHTTIIMTVPCAVNDNLIRLRATNSFCDHSHIITTITSMIIPCTLNNNQKRVCAAKSTSVIAATASSPPPSPSWSSLTLWTTIRYMDTSQTPAPHHLKLLGHQHQHHQPLVLYVIITHIFTSWTTRPASVITTSSSPSSSSKQ